MNQRSRLVLPLALAALVGCATPGPGAPLGERTDPAAVTPSSPVPLPSAPSEGQSPDDGRGPAWRITVSGLIGYRKLDEDSWRQETARVSVEQDDQLVFGVESDFRPRDFPLGVEVGLSDSFAGETKSVNGRDTSITSNLFEAYVGPRLTFDVAHDTVHPYVGAGVTALFANFDQFVEVSNDTYLVSSRDESSLAGYAHVGALFDVARAFHIGIDGRGVFWSDLGSGTDADYYQITAVFGTHW